jgi:hypothetical protein
VGPCDMQGVRGGGPAKRRLRSPTGFGSASADRRSPSADFLTAWRSILASSVAAIAALKSSRYRPRNSAQSTPGFRQPHAA